jgi:soluble lytic murein transglycosylase-like protein
MGKMLTALFLGIACFLCAFFVQVTVEKETAIPESSQITTKSPPCVQMFYAIEKYSEKYKIPKNYAYGIAYEETRYRGPFQWDYNHAQTSFANAVGPMQIMYPTAQFLFPDKRFSREFLKTDIDFNVECSMKLLRYLHDKYGDWKTVFGAYNTGRPLVNGYAINVFTHKMK